MTPQSQYPQVAIQHTGLENEKQGEQEQESQELTMMDLL
jgi:hypothetical protein